MTPTFAEKMQRHVWLGEQREAKTVQPTAAPVWSFKNICVTRKQQIRHPIIIIHRFRVSTHPRTHPPTHLAVHLSTAPLNIKPTWTNPLLTPFRVKGKRVSLFLSRKKAMVESISNFSGGVNLQFQWEGITEQNRRFCFPLLLLRPPPSLRQQDNEGVRQGPFSRYLRVPAYF